MSRLKAAVLALVLVGSVAAVAPSADAQVVVRFGHRHHYYHHHYYHHYHHHYYHHY